MVWMPDDSMSTTLSIATEGHLKIVSHTFPASAHAGDTVSGYTITFLNNGATTDKFYVEVKRTDTGSMLLQSTYIVFVGAYLTVTPFIASFVMPSTPVIITINTWHEE
jgi:hypothetical protein